MRSKNFGREMYLLFKSGAAASSLMAKYGLPYNEFQRIIQEEKKKEMEGTQCQKLTNH